MWRLWEASALAFIVLSISLPSFSAASSSPSSLVLSVLILNFGNGFAMFSFMLGEDTSPSTGDEDQLLTVVVGDDPNFGEGNRKSDDNDGPDHPKRTTELIILSGDAGNLEKLRYSHSDHEPPDETSDSTAFSTVVFTTSQDAAPSPSRGMPNLFAGHKNRFWGSHPLPPLDAFVSTGGRWVAYFFDEAIAVVQHTDDGTILNCTIQEVIEVWEQRAALEYLGQVMPLVPQSLSSMVHLITLCGTLGTNQPLPIPYGQDSRGADTSWWLGLSALQGILPGTLWCGKSDQATYYRQLGIRSELDSCCRAHDHCPIKVLPLRTRYGYTNYGIGTLSHCLCDLEFFRCLKGAQDTLAETVGLVYFNLLRMPCLVPVSSHRRHSQQSLSTPEGLHPSPPSVQHSEERASVRSRQSNITEHDTRGPPAPSNQRTGSPRVVVENGSVGGPRARPQYRPADNSNVATEGRVTAYDGSLSSRRRRLECTRVDQDGACRMWFLNPKGFTLRHTALPTSLRF